jgi:hypothetical protein
MQPAPGRAGPLGELAHQRQDRVADRLGLTAQARQVEGVGARPDGIDRRRDCRGGLFRHDPEAGLGARERRLDLGAAGKEGELAEHRAHRGGAEHVAEQGRLQDADGHDHKTTKTRRARRCRGSKDETF